MSETISAVDINGKHIALPISDLAHVFSWSGGQLVRDTVQYQTDQFSNPVYYTQTNTYGAQGSGIASVAVNTGGEFSTLTLPLVAGSPGAGATFAPVMSLHTATIASGGTGYTALDVLTFVGGTHTTAAQVTVATVNGSGVILTVTNLTIGSYTILPTAPVSVTGGTGTLATFNPTWLLASLGITAGGYSYTAASTITFAGTIITQPTVTLSFTSDPTIVGVLNQSQWVAHL